MASAIVTEPVENADGVQDMQGLSALLGKEHMALLVELLETIIGDSGYGGVEIVVADGRVQSMKLTKSYRAKTAAE